MFPFHTVLCPVDFSAASRRAFRLAARLTGEAYGMLIVVHVQPPSPEDLIPAAGSEVRRNKLRHALGRFKPFDPRVHVEHRLVEGDAASEILREAQAARCDLIVMGTHGRMGIERLLLGSVAEEVMRNAPCPVVTVRTPVPARTAPQECVSVSR
jgi:nucleotide-binding universal stress UspA family protein